MKADAKQTISDVSMPSEKHDFPWFFDLGYIRSAFVQYAQISLFTIFSYL